MIYKVPVTMECYFIVKAKNPEQALRRAHYLPFDTASMEPGDFEFETPILIPDEECEHESPTIDFDALFEEEASVLA